MHNSAQASDKPPTTRNRVMRPSAASPIIDPLTKDATPQANCCTDELRLIKAPRCRGSTAAVIIAIAGTIRPDMQIISKVEVASATGNGERGRFVSRKIGTSEESDIMVKTFNLPERSAHRPIQFMLNRVHKPPVR